MKVMMSAAMATLTMSVAPAAAQQVDSDMLCLVAMAAKSSVAGEAGLPRTNYDSGGGYYLAIVSKRYPTVPLFAPVMDAAAKQLMGGDTLDAVSETCMAGIVPAYDLISKSLDLLGK